MRKRRRRGECKEGGMEKRGVGSRREEGRWKGEGWRREERGGVVEMEEVKKEGGRSGEEGEGGREEGGGE